MFWYFNKTRSFVRSANIMPIKIKEGGGGQVHSWHRVQSIFVVAANSSDYAGARVRAAYIPCYDAWFVLISEGAFSQYAADTRILVHKKPGKALTRRTLPCCAMFMIDSRVCILRVMICGSSSHWSIVCPVYNGNRLSKFSSNPVYNVHKSYLSNTFNF